MTVLHLLNSQKLQQETQIRAFITEDHVTLYTSINHVRILKTWYRDSHLKIFINIIFFIFFQVTNDYKVHKDRDHI